MSFISLDYSNLELHGLVDFIKFERDSSAACRSFDYEACSDVHSFCNSLRDSSGGYIF